MHIPDGFLDAKTAISTGLFSLTGLGAALRITGKKTESKRIPLFGIAAAFVFVAQMINFPVASGTSGHLLGATLVAVLLGPSAAIIVMSSVLIIQSLLFADGGILSLGANIFNMAIVAPLLGNAIYKIVRSVFRDERGRLIAASVAAWCTIVIVAVVCAMELAWSGTTPLRLVVPAMAGIHMVIGLGEAAITMLVLSAIAKTRPDLLNGNKVVALQSGDKRLPFPGILLFLGLLLLMVPLASEFPDGLERVAHTLGFAQKVGADGVSISPFRDYLVPGIHSAFVSTIVAAIVGALVVFVLSIAMARVLVPRAQSVDELKTEVD
jgi:cobalt/nickel transport system permease protein